MKLSISLLIGILVYWYIPSISPIHAQSVGLSISPPVVEILLAPNKKVVQTFTIKNQGESVDIIPSLRSVTPIDSLGHVTVDPTPLSPASIPLVVTLAPSPFGKPITLPAGASIPLTLSFDAASTDIPIDTYLAFVVQTSPLSRDGSSTSTTPAIAGLILATVTPSGNLPANLEIINFEPPFIHDSSQAFTLLPGVRNHADIMIRPGLELSILNAGGSLTYHPEIVKNLILKNSDRDFGPLTWNPAWSDLGPHRIRLSVLTEGGTKLTQVERLVWFLPIRAIIIILLLAIIMGTVIIRQRKGSGTTLALLIAFSLINPTGHAAASLTGVSDTLSTSELSTLAAPISPRHTITFTPAMVIADGYFRILLPADPTTASDGIPDDEGYDMDGTVAVQVGDVAGYQFDDPLIIPAGDPGCLVPAYFHCFELHYSGVGGVGSPITVTIGNSDGSASLLAPIAAAAHQAGKADIYSFVVRHYDNLGVFRDYTIGNIGHVEGVQVTARVKGTPQPGFINLITIPYLPSAITSRYNLAALALASLALGLIMLIILLWSRRKNILIIDAITQKPVDYFVLYHSLPETRRGRSRILMTRYEPISYQATKHNHGRLYIRNLGRYSTLTVRIGDTTHILSLSIRQRFYTIPL